MYNFEQQSNLPRENPKDGVFIRSKFVSVVEPFREGESELWDSVRLT